MNLSLSSASHTTLMNSIVPHQSQCKPLINFTILPVHTHLEFGDFYPSCQNQLHLNFFQDLFSPKPVFTPNLLCVGSSTRSVFFFPQLNQHCCSSSSTVVCGFIQLRFPTKPSFKLQFLFRPLTNIKANNQQD